MEQEAARNERKKSKRRGYVPPPTEEGKATIKGSSKGEDPGEGKIAKQKQEMIDLQNKQAHQSDPLYLLTFVLDKIEKEEKLN